MDKIIGDRIKVYDVGTFILWCERHGLDYKKLLKDIMKLED